MRVGVERDAHVGVAEALADDLGRDAGAQRRGGVAVAEIMQTDPGEPGPLRVRGEPVADPGRVDAGAVLLNDKLVVVPAWTERQLFLALLAPGGFWARPWRGRARPSGDPSPSLALRTRPARSRRR